MRKWLWTAGITAIVLLAVSPFIAWALKGKTDFNVLIIDKTVPDSTYREHQGLVWMLNQSKLVKDGQAYDAKEDYVGFVPGDNDKYTIRSLPKQNDYDMIYLADGYGVYEEDLNGGVKEGNRSKLLYGGVTSEDIAFIRTSLYDHHSTLVGEFNSFASPTPKEVRTELYDLYNVTWTGWIGRYFEDFSSSEVPNWAKLAYREQFGEEWALTGKGLLFVNEQNELIVITEKELKDNPVWFQYTKSGQKELGLNDEAAYQYWFDVIQAQDESEIQATYTLNLKDSAKQKLSEHNIPTTIPAVTYHKTSKYNTYYFAGDFADEGEIPAFHQASFYPTWKKWITSLRKDDSTAFYWNIYIPLMKEVVTQSKETKDQKLPIEIYSGKNYQSTGKAGDDYLQVYKDGKWQDILVKGVNMGIANPGHFPGETAITKAEYMRWFKQIGEMNANAIRVYTIHPPGFYEALAEYNQQAKDPLYIFHGVWINEEVFYESQDAFSKENTDEFVDEIKRVVDLVHGNATLPKRAGHASGTYKADVSPYVLGWMIGVEWDPDVALSTNEKHQGMKDFKGKYIYTQGAQPFEVWLAEMMEQTIDYEQENYNWQRPMSFTNWVTTDLLTHPSEPSEDEDKITVNPNLIHATDQFEPGLFASYHIYPYYPDFLNYESRYVNYVDHRGNKNNYAGYLQHMKEVHNMPLLVAEFGIPASRGLTHRNRYGWNQGFHSEQEQGEMLTHLFEDIVEEKMAGGLVFTWQDEWFKRTWNTMDYDNPDRRPFWNNMQTNEQHFGLLSFEPGREQKVIIDGKEDDWKKATTESSSSSSLKNFQVTSDEGYLYVKGKSDNLKDESLYVLFNTIKDQGQSNIKQLPGLKTQGIDFVAELNGKENSHLWIDSYYDTFYFSYAHKLQMIPTVPYANQKDNGVFHPIRLTLNKELQIKNGSGKEEIIPFESYETGKLRFGTTDPEDKNFDSLTDYYLNQKTGVFELRIPWALLNMKDPSSREAMGDVWKKGELSESVTLDGIDLAVVAVDRKTKAIKDTIPAMKENRLEPKDFYHYTWKTWQEPTHHERLKSSYYILQDTFKNQRLGGE